MSRALVPVLVLVAMLLGAPALGSLPTAAQEATPPGAATAAPIPGYETELLGLASPSAAPDHALQLIRITFAPGVETPPHARPGDRINYVLEGTYVFRLQSGAVEAKRLATGGATGPAEALEPGTEYTFTAGDAVFLHADAVYGSHNPGPGQLVVMVAALSPADALTTTYLAATPAP